MSPIRTETYALARPVPHFPVRGLEEVFSCPVRYGSTGALVEPDSGTVTIVDPAGDSIVSAAAVTVSSSTAHYTWAPPAAGTLGAGWEFRWNLIFAGQAYPPFVLTAYLCDYIPPCTISAQDLFTREPELRALVPQAQGERGDNTGWQPQIDEAYWAFLQRLLDDARKPWLIREVTGTRDWLRSEALYRATRTLATSEDSIWWRKSEGYRHEHRQAEGSLRIQYRDTDPDTRRAGSPVIRLAPVGRPRW